MRKLLLVLLFPALLLAGTKTNVQYDSANHKVYKPPTVTGMPDYDYTGVNVVGLAAAGGGGGTPGGADRQLQFNNAFTFGGVPFATFDSTTQSMTFRTGARFILADPTDILKKIQLDLSQIPSGQTRQVTIAPSADSGTVIPLATAPNLFVTGIANGILLTAQPSFANLSGTLALSQTSMSSGKLLGRYSAATGAIQEITPDGVTVFLDPGTGVLSAAGGGGPGGSTTQFQYNNGGVLGGQNSLIFSGGFVQARDTTFRLFNNSDSTKTFNFDGSNVPASTNETIVVPNSSNPTIVGGLAAPVANQWVQYITGLGVQTLTQPNFTDIAGVIGLGQNNFPINLERFVDPINGSDITGAANLAKPFLTLPGAALGAPVGTVFYLYPNPTGYDLGTTPFVIPAGTTIVGAGPDVTLIKGAFGTSTRGVVEPSTATGIYNVTIQNTSAAGFAYGVGPSSAAFTSAFIGGSKIIANNGVGIHVSKAGTTGLVAENVTVSTQNDCFFQDTSTAITTFRNCDLFADGSSGNAARGLDVTNGTVRFNYGNITVGNSATTNVGARADGATTTVELHGVRISNTGGGTTNNDVRQTNSASLGVDNVTRPDAGPLVTFGTITQLSRYALRDNNLTDFPNIGAGVRGDIIFRGATGWTKLGGGLDGNVLTTHGTTADPEWLTGGGGGGAVSDTAFGVGWDAQTTTGASQNVLYDYFHIMSPADNGKIGVLNIAAGIPKTSAGGVVSLAVAGTDYITPTGTSTLSNKRIVRREQAVVAPTPAPVVDTNNFDSIHYTGISGSMTSITTTGTPNPGDTLMFDFTDDGNARAITFDPANFEASPGQVLPTTTTASTRLDVGFKWNPVTSKWRCLASSNASAGGAGATGTVTSVGITGANGVTSSGGPIASSGNITVGLPITLAGTAGKTLTVNNSIGLAAANDVSSLNIGTGGTLGSNAFTSTAFLTASNISDGSFGSTWNTDATTAPSKNTLYDYLHISDTDDNGLPNKLDMTDGIAKVTSNVVGPAVAGTDYADLAFRTIAVSGQSNVVADSASDTLTLAAGANVTITTTPGTDTVTIASTAGGGGIQSAALGGTGFNNSGVTNGQLLVGISSTGVFQRKTLTGSGATMSMDNNGVLSLSDINTNIIKATNLTTNGYVKTSGSDGTLSVDSGLSGAGVVGYDVPNSGGLFKLNLLGLLYTGATGTLKLDSTSNAGWQTAQSIGITDANNTPVTLLSLQHNSTGTAGIGLGSALEFQGQTSGSGFATNVKMGDLTYAWSTTNNATRTSYATVNLVNSATAAEAIRIFPTKALGVGRTTDPGAGYVDVSTGYKINSTEFPLASNGIAKRTAANTYAAATSTDVVGLFTSCSGTQYLGADGACHTAGGTGDVVGPSSATDNAIARFDTTTGKLIQNSVVSIADTTGAVANAGTAPSITATGAATNIDLTLTTKGTGWLVVNGANPSALPVTTGTGLAIGNNIGNTVSEVDFLNLSPTANANELFRFMDNSSYQAARIIGTNGGVFGAIVLGHGTTFPATTTGFFMPSVGYVGWNSDTALYRNAAGVVEINNGTAGTYRDLICRNITISGGNFSGRINPRVDDQNAPSSPYAVNSDSYDMAVLRGINGALTINAPTGTPVQGQNLVYRFKDDGTARALTFQTGSSGQFRFSSDMAAPATTVISKTFYVGFKYNSTDSRWDNVAQMNNF